jgi:phosphohistidine phosphatase
VQACGMKTLFLVRHAKSSWDDPALADEDRPLNDRGKRDAPKMAKRLAKRHAKVDLMLSSPATRAIKTAKALAEKLDYKLKDIVVDERLYPGAATDILKFIHGLGNKINRVILVGHHPALSKLAHRLSSDITHMPTCAVAEFTFKAKSWRDAGKTTLIAVGLDLPKNPMGSFAVHKQGDTNAER